MGKDNQHSLKDAIQGMLAKYGLKDKVNEARIITLWETILGKSLGKHTKSIYVKDGKLIVHIDSAPLKNDLMYTRTRIIERLNEEIGEEVITEIIIR